MQVLYIILGALAILILGLFVFSLYLPSRLKIERSLVIDARPEVVFREVDTLRNWERWSPWHQLDPAMKLVYGEKSSGAGASYSWESRKRNVGRGSLIITESRPYEYIGIHINFMEKGSSKGYFRFEPAGERTRVIWGMEMAVGQNPARKVMGLMMDKWIGRDFERGLQQLAAASTAEGQLH
jgi:hypothetical protein